MAKLGWKRFTFSAEKRAKNIAKLDWKCYTFFNREGIMMNLISIVFNFISDFNILNSNFSGGSLTLSQHSSQSWPLWVIPRQQMASLRGESTLHCLKNTAETSPMEIPVPSSFTAQCIRRSIPRISPASGLSQLTLVTSWGSILGMPFA